MSVAFSYKLDGTPCTIEIDGETVSLWHSGHYDTLDELVTATWSLVAHGTDETVEFCDDLDCSRLKLHPKGTRLALRAVEWKGTFASENDPSGRVIFEAECRLRTFAGAVLSATQLLLKTHGLEGYGDIMSFSRYRFPLGRMEMLKQALRDGKA